MAAMAACQPVHAGQCTAPPYGSATTAFKAFIDRWSSTDSASLITILENACRARFQHGDRRPLYTAGLTDAEINARDPVSLADTWMRATIESLKRPAPAEHYAYALFLCGNAAPCQIYGEIHLGPRGTPYSTSFDTLAKCRRQASLNSSGAPFEADGHIHLPGGYFWECRQQRVDDWTPAP